MRDDRQPSRFSTNNGLPRCASAASVRFRGVNNPLPLKTGASEVTRMFDKYKSEIQAELDGIKEAGTWKAERIIESPQSAAIKVGDKATTRF